ncbi:hypothetical protein HG530_013342 [Fusarium avenaceum]|nr:hypothetical protein HG530_013342 [Fusarium avenaceum]
MITSELQPSNLLKFINGLKGPTKVHLDRSQPLFPRCLKILTNIVQKNYLFRLDARLPVQTFPTSRLSIAFGKLVDSSQSKLIHSRIWLSNTNMSRGDKNIKNLSHRFVEEVVKVELMAGWEYDGVA